ncbi:MAG TPA: hypothetical protein VN611_18215 [Patescibacteria group bacterium]|nr:hypothetical protein [Patescibacteria group bacterium]
MKRWAGAVLAAGVIVLSMLGPAAAVVNTANTPSEFTYYKIGVFFTVGETVAADSQGFHLHGQISNKYNVLGIEKFKYAPQYDLVVAKLSGLIEVAQAEVP